MTPKISDTAALLADRGAGMTQRQLAEKYGVSGSTISYQLRKLNSEASPAKTAAPVTTTEPETAAPDRSNTNGHPSSLPSTLHPVTELEQLLAEHCNRIPIVERVRILLSPA